MAVSSVSIERMSLQQTMSVEEADVTLKLSSVAWKISRYLKSQA